MPSLKFRDGEAKVTRFSAKVICLALLLLFTIATTIANAITKIETFGKLCQES